MKPIIIKETKSNRKDRINNWQKTRTQILPNKKKKISRKKIKNELKKYLKECYYARL